MIISAKVYTNQKEFRIVKGGIWKIWTRSPPENNRANIEIIKELSKEYTHVKILRGLKKPQKTIEIR